MLCIAPAYRRYRPRYIRCSWSVAQRHQMLYVTRVSKDRRRKNALPRACRTRLRKWRGVETRQRGRYDSMCRMRKEHSLLPTRRASPGRRYARAGARGEGDRRGAQESVAFQRRSMPAQRRGCVEEIRRRRWQAVRCASNGTPYARHHNTHVHAMRCLVIQTARTNGMLCASLRRGRKGGWRATRVVGGAGRRWQAEAGAWCVVR